MSMLGVVCDARVRGHFFILFLINNMHEIGFETMLMELNESHANNASSVDHIQILALTFGCWWLQSSFSITFRIWCDGLLNFFHAPHFISFSCVFSFLFTLWKSWSLSWKQKKYWSFQVELYEADDFLHSLILAGEMGEI